MGKKNPLSFVISSLVKILGGSIPCCTDNFNVESIAELRCSEESIPQFVRDIFQPIQNQLAALGFHSPVYYALWDGYHLNRIYRVEYAAQNGEGMARIHYRQWEKTHPIKKTTYVVFASFFADDTMLVSSSARWSTAPANVTLNNLPGAAPEVLWRSHLEKLQQIQKSTYQITGTDSVIWAGEKYHADFFNFYLKRGLFRPLSEAEQQSEAANRGTYQEMQSAGKQYPQILMEINKLQEQKSPKWTRLLVILGLSALLFIALGIQSWGRDYILLLIPVLLFHEAGHYLMMRIFGYRNLKMFFIPLFGAAVSGRHYNVAGWKKVVVSLMGPTPGIVLGALLGCLGLLFHHPFLQKFSLLFLIINGFNLIPFIPLDGGWALQGIIFSRHFIFDLAFKVVAALAMLGLSIVLKTKALMYVGIATLVSLPAAFAVAKATGNLRKKGFVAASPDDQNIPDVVAETIITELRTTMPKAGTSKNMAQLTLQVFENLNAKPPGWAASLSLLTWYGCAVLTAVLFTAIVAAGRGGMLGDLLNGGMVPRLKYECHSVKPVRHGESNGSFLNLVVTMDKAAKAESAFNALVPQLGEQESLEKIGQTLVLTMPAGEKKARQNWLNRLEAYSTNAFVDWTNNSAQFYFICVAPNQDAASNITAELRDYFTLPQLGHYLVSPWTRNDTRSAGQKAADDKARRTYQKLISDAFAGFDNPKLRDLQNKVLDARRHGDGEVLQDLTRQIEATTKEIRKEGFDRIRGDTSMDASLVDLYEKREDLPYTNSARHDLSVQITKELGVAEAQRQPITGAGLYAARTGNAFSKGLIINVNFVSFADTFEGAPALLDWLCDKGCIGVRYSIMSSPYVPDEELLDQ